MRSQPLCSPERARDGTGGSPSGRPHKGELGRNCAWSVEQSQCFILHSGTPLADTNRESARPKACLEVVLS
jgi:hypothetical protein